MSRDSEFACEVVRVTAVSPHGNADRLEVASFETADGPSAYQTVTARGAFASGDLALYVGVDCVVPRSAGPAFAFLFERPDGVGKDTFRVKAARLRGVYSEGFLVPLHAVGLAEGPWGPGSKLGDECAAALGITYHAAPAPGAPGAHADPSLGGRFPVYSVDSLRKVPRIFEDGEVVIYTEKIHGTNFRAGWLGGRFVVGSHRTVKTDARSWWRRLWDWARRRRVAAAGPGDTWVDAAAAHGLEAGLRAHPDLVVYGEVFGTTRDGKRIQDLTYGAPVLGLRLFDAYDPAARAWLPWDALLVLCLALGVPTVPVLEVGPWSLARARALAEGRSAFADELREGCVVRHPVDGRRAKWVGEGYRMRKEKP